MQCSKQLIMLGRIFLVVLCVKAVFGAYKLHERYGWNQMDFQFPNPLMKEQARRSGDYIPQNALPVGIEQYKEKLFVTVPRWRDGKCCYNTIYPYLVITY